MNILLDTHILLWYLEDNPKLLTRAKSLIEDRHNPVAVSIASFWEITIKVTLGKLTLMDDIATLEAIVQSQGIAILPIRIAHLLRLKTLPFHHRDPFDRLLVAQAMEEGMSLMTEDRHLAAYPGTWLCRES